MKTCSKTLLALIISSVTLVGAAGLASARGGYCFEDGFHGMRGYGAMQNISPEARQGLAQAHETLAPLFLEYRAKQAELTAKIYSGADDKLIQELTKEVERLHVKLTEGKVALQKQMVKAGVPLRGCRFMMDGWKDYDGHGRGRHGRMGGYGHRGYGGPHHGGYYNGPDANRPAQQQPQ